MVSQKMSKRMLFVREVSKASFRISSLGGSSRKLKAIGDTAELDGTEQQSQSELRPPRRVSFAEGPQLCQELIFDGSLTDVERQRYYYNAEDLVAFQKDRALTALMYKMRRAKGIAWDEDDGELQHSIRGIEDLLEQIRCSSRQNHSMNTLQRRNNGSNNNNINNNTYHICDMKLSARKQHVERVIQEQTQQRVAERIDAESLRDVSCQSSKEERQRAAVRGREDAHAVYKTGTRFTMKKMRSKLALW